MQLNLKSYIYSPPTEKLNNENKQSFLSVKCEAISSLQFRRTHNGHSDLRNRTLAAADHAQRMGLITAWLFCGLGINESWERGWSPARADSSHRS